MFWIPDIHYIRNTRLESVTSLLMTLLTSLTYLGMVKIVEKIRDIKKLGEISYGQTVDRTSPNMGIYYGQDWLKKWAVHYKLTWVKLFWSIELG